MPKKKNNYCIEISTRLHNIRNVVYLMFVYSFHRSDSFGCEFFDEMFDLVRPLQSVNVKLIVFGVCRQQRDKYLPTNPKWKFSTFFLILKSFRTDMFAHRLYRDSVQANSIQYFP